MIEIARREADRAGVASACAWHVSDFLSYQSPDTFDAVVAIGYFDYLEDPLPHLRKMIGHAEGRVFASFPKRWTVRTGLRMLRFQLARGFVRFYSRGEVVELFRQAGSVACLALVDLGRDYVAIYDAGAAAVEDRMSELRVLHVITRLIVGGAQENTLLTAIGQHRTPGFRVTLLGGHRRRPRRKPARRGARGGRRPPADARARPADRTSHRRDRAREADRLHAPRPVRHRPHALVQGGHPGPHRRPRCRRADRRPHAAQPRLRRAREPAPERALRQSQAPRRPSHAPLHLGLRRDAAWCTRQGHRPSRAALRDLQRLPDRALP